MLGSLALAVGIAVALYFLAAWLRRRWDPFAIGRARPRSSRVDGMPYRVHPGHGAPEDAADMLAALNARVIRLLRSLRARYVWDLRRGADFPERRVAAVRLLARYNPDNLAENSPMDPGGDTSYTVGKGAVVALCLRERSRRATLHDLGTLTFVTLHELAHIAVDDIDHPPRFWRAFRFLLEEACLAGIYCSPDYSRMPVRYCGLDVDYNPAFDAKVASL